MRTVYRFSQVVILCALVVASPGCFVIESFVSTQPRIDFDDRYFSQPAQLVDGHAVVYWLGYEEVGTTPDEEANLLASHAPILIQGVLAPEDDDYRRDSDEIGTPLLHEGEEPSVSIDTRKPAMYGRIEKETVNGVELTQLVYVFWYPRHPVSLVESGPIDGGVLRITLDAADRPAVFEYTQPCGCYHGAFVAEHVEAWAQSDFGERASGKEFYTEKSVSGAGDWVVREVVEDDGRDIEPRPVLWVTAGDHRCVAIEMLQPAIQLDGLPQRSYVLKNYSALQALVVDGESPRHGSMFDSDGFVWGAERSMEEAVFSDVDHAGWPRHLDRVKVHFDDANWTDAHLLERFLRLPKELTEASAGVRRLEVAGPRREDAGLEQSPLIRGLAETGHPFALLVVHEKCVACHVFAKKVLNDPEAQTALDGWTWKTVDMAKQDGRDLAQRARVAVTPTLILLDARGRELERVEGIGSLADLQEALRSASGKMERDAK